MDREPRAPLLLGLSESGALAREIAAAVPLPLAAVEERSFEGGEFKLRPLQSVRDRTVYVIQSLAGDDAVSASERLLRLLFLVSTLRDGGARRCVALIPYLAFARKERRTQLRDPINTRYVAQLLEAAGTDQVMLLDVHNPAAIDNAFRIPMDHLSALPMMVDHFARHLPGAELMIVSPDIGGIKRTQIFRELLQQRIGRDVELGFIEKRRARGVVSSGALVGNPLGRTLIVLDDLCATGTTLLRAAEVCRGAGAAAVHVAVTHVPLTAGLAALLAAAPIEAVVTTDSVGHPPAVPDTDSDKLTVLSVAPLFGQAIARISAGLPLAPLLEHWPVTDPD